MVELHNEKSLYQTGGGGARGGRGGCFHLSFRSGSRGGGARARSAYQYVTRTGRYDEPERDDAVYVESDHMPPWAVETPENFWDEADVRERSNARLYVSADSALPVELDREAQIELAEEFAHELTDAEQLPYTPRSRFPSPIVSSCHSAALGRRVIAGVQHVRSGSLLSGPARSH